jgi:hypothetical protein
LQELLQRPSSSGDSHNEKARESPPGPRFEP